MSVTKKFDEILQHYYYLMQLWTLKNEIFKVLIPYQTMPTIAQKLCNEIIEPILASSSNDITRTVPSKKSIKGIRGNSTIRFAKPTRSIVVEKKKVINQLEPNNKTVINKLQSKEKVIRKDFTDTAVNTLISGPLRCDNYCVTNIRKRENNCSCKFKKRIKTKASTKHVQTLNKICSQSDKACTHCVDRTHCGTQFIENFNSGLRTQISNRLLFRKNNECEPQFNYNRHTPQKSNIMNKSMNLNLNAKRWALSNYPVRGPDF